MLPYVTVPILLQFLGAINYIGESLWAIFEKSDYSPTREHFPSMENPILYTSVLERFPESADRIVQLAQSNATFTEICNDYQELAQWLQAYDHECDTPEIECADNRLLLAELEIEILQFLQAVDHQPGH